MKEINFNCMGMGVQCLLHTQCNLRCKFCFETKEKGIRENNCINIDYIKKLPDEVVSVIAPVIKKNDIKTFSLYIMGGELFSDDISDSVFDAYEEFLCTLRSKLKDETDVTCSFSVVSNGVFTNHERVEKFLRLFNARLILSYDPVDRFSCDSQKDIWYNTYKYFTDRNFGVILSTLLTKRTINAYIKGDDIFEKIGNNVFVDSNIYVPRLDYQEYLPGDEDLFNFYKWALDNRKFNISDVTNILKHSHICQQEFYYAFGEEIGENHISNCLEGLPFSKEEYYGECSDQIIDDRDCLKYKQPLGVQRRGCLMCEYYMDCSEMCWTQVLFNKYEITQCPIQRVYQYIENNPDILIDFENWRKQYEQNWMPKSISF